MNRNIVVIVSDGENDPDLLPDEFERLINLATRFKSGGGTIACVGVRAAGHGFRLLRGLATPGFFINVFGDAAAVQSARASLLGSLGQICASSTISFPGPQSAAANPLPSLEIFGNDPPADLCVPALAKALHRVFFGAGEVDPFFGTSEYRALTPIRGSSGPTLIRWTVPDLSLEQRIDADFFGNAISAAVATIWFNTTTDFASAKTLNLGVTKLVYIPPGLQLWGVLGAASLYSTTDLATLTPFAATHITKAQPGALFGSYGQAIAFASFP